MSSGFWSVLVLVLVLVFSAPAADDDRLDLEDSRCVCIMPCDDILKVLLLFVPMLLATFAPYPFVPEDVNPVFVIMFTENALDRNEVDVHATILAVKR